MPNLSRVLKDEITRLARREIGAHAAALHRASSAHRRDIAALKRQNAQLQRTVQSLSKGAAKREPAVAPTEATAKLRFRVEGFKSLRKKLGLSAEAMAALLGVSPQSVYGWEHGRATPRRSQLPAIAALRSMGKREALRRLEESAGARGN
jgi:DNA-binding transcriptional regulator YiaG